MLSSVIGAVGDLAGGFLNAASNKKIAKMNIDAQREFAQNGIRWKVADARAAGLHPLVSLGAQTASFTPSMVGDNSLGDAVANMGQNIGRAIDAKATEEERRKQEEERMMMEYSTWQANMNETQARTRLYDAQTSTEMKRASVLGQPRNPAFPSGGRSQASPKLNLQDPTGISNDVPAMVSLYQNNDGTMTVLPSEEASEAMEGIEPFGSIPFFYDYYVKPFFSSVFTGKSTLKPVITKEGDVYQHRMGRYRKRQDPYYLGW